MNQSNYRNNRFNNKRNNAHKYSMGSVFKKFMHFFNFRFRRNKVNEPLKQSSPISRVFSRRKTYFFKCKPMTSPGQLKQAASMEKLHGHLWNGSSKVVA